MAFELIVRNAHLVSASGTRATDIAIADGRIASLSEPGSLPPGSDEVDARDLLMVPGVVDEHVHFREPGLEREETWLSGSRAAVLGGVTSVLEMPNTLPPTDTPERARDKLRLARRTAHCDFGLFGLVGGSADAVRRLADSRTVIGFKAFLGPTTGDLPAPTDAALEAALTSGLRVAVHAEDREVIRRAPQRPVEAEVAAIERLGRLLDRLGGRAHVLHLTSAAGLAEIERWRARGADLTCEVTPHHLLLDADATRPLGGIAKVNPPLRSAADAAALREALADGRIDTVGSDHAPHHAAHKRRADLAAVPAGFAGVETLLPLLLTLVNDGQLQLERLVSATSQRPAQIWGIWPRKGAVEPGSDADLTLIDMRRPGVVRAADLHGLNNLSPFEGRATLGSPVTTIVRGRIVVRDATLAAEPGWGRPVIDENDQARHAG